MTSTTNGLYGELYQQTVAVLRYAMWLDPRGDQYTPNVPTAHPEGVIVDQQLFTDRRRLALYLNTEYLADLVSVDDELIPDTLEIPLYSPSQRDQPWLVYWHGQAMQAEFPPYSDYAEPVDYSHALRAPNIAAAVAFFESYATATRHIPAERRPTLFIPGQCCFIQTHQTEDYWFVANASHWDEQRMLPIADPTAAGELYGFISGLFSRNDAFSDTAQPFTNAGDGAISA